MKLIKIKEDHYVVVDETKEIQTNDKYLTSDNRIVNWYKEFEENIKENRPSPITHSSQPLEYDEDNTYTYDKVKYIPLSYIKELIGEVDVEKKAETQLKLIDSVVCLTTTREEENIYIQGFYNGYNQALEDNKEKKYTEEDLQNAWKIGYRGEPIEELTHYFQPKTEWEVEWEICETYRLDECNSRFACCNKPKKLKIII